MKLSKQDVDYIISCGSFGKYLLDRYNETSIRLIRCYELRTFNIKGYNVYGFNHWQSCNFEILRAIKNLLKDKQ